MEMFLLYSYVFIKPKPLSTAASVTLEDMHNYGFQLHLFNMYFFSGFLHPSLLQCSVTCGRGTKQREIVCVYQNQTKIEEEHCSHLPRPRSQKACRSRGCPSWKANKWSEVCFLFSPSRLDHRVASEGP